MRTEIGRKPGISECAIAIAIGSASTFGRTCLLGPARGGFLRAAILRCECVAFMPPQSSGWHQPRSVWADPSLRLNCLLGWDSAHGTCTLITTCDAAASSRNQGQRGLHPRKSGSVSLGPDDSNYKEKSPRFWREPFLQIEEAYLRGRAKATPKARPPSG